MVFPTRPQVWCWSHPHTGVSLTRGGVTVVDDETEAPDPRYDSTHFISMLLICLYIIM